MAVAAYAFAVDAVLFAAVPSVGRYLPGKAGDGLAGLPDRTCWRPGGAAVMAAWTLAFILAAIWRTDHTDVRYASSAATSASMPAISSSTSRTTSRSALTAMHRSPA